MALDLRLERGTGAAVGDDEWMSLDDEPWKLAATLGVAIRVLARIGEQLWDDPRVESSELSELADELRRLREAVVARHTAAIRARDAATRARLVAEMTARNPPSGLAAIDAMLGLCERAMAAGVGLQGTSD